MTVLNSADLTPRALCDAVERVILGQPRSATDLRFDGAAQPVALACELAYEHAETRP